MWKKNASLLLLISVASILFAPGCAMITRKRTQKVPVTSSPLGATVIVNGQQQGVTPLELRLVRKKKGQVIRIESPGYNPVEIRLNRKMSVGPILGNFLLGVIPGIGCMYLYALTVEDAFMTNKVPIGILGAAAFGGLFTIIERGGKGFELVPKELVVTLTKADGMPRVDTILINATDLQNIKWIRVRKD